MKHRTFKDLPSSGELLAAKKSRDLTVSVCLPALNEQDTIADICSCIRTELVDTGIADELIVMDSGSTDQTAAVAEKQGASVFVSSQVLPALEPVGGKGDSLWKSLAVLHGEIVVWLDADVRNFESRFVTNLLAPLLMHEEVKFTKAFYGRPLGSDEDPTKGGRVTELVARPLLNLFFPRLSAMIQPLSGEYAGYTELLRALPFSTGYGVDVGLLIDVADRVGLDALAQVDLGQRVHRNRDTLELGPMAFDVIRAIFSRAEDAGLAKFSDELGHTLTQFRRGVDGYAVEQIETRFVERPPMETIL